MSGLSSEVHSKIVSLLPFPSYSAPLFSGPGSILCFFSAEELFNIEGWGLLYTRAQKPLLAGFFVRHHYIFIDLQRKTI